LPINLRDPEIAFRAGDAAADGIGDPLAHLRHGKAAVAAEAVATQVALGVLAEIEGVEAAAQALGLGVGLPQFYGQVSRHLQVHHSRFRMALLKGNWWAITHRGMEALPIAAAFYSYPEIV
jgi:hypothetical protein